MTLNLNMPKHEELRPRITVFGVGGAGGNAVNNMISKRLEGVEFVTANTDAQALAQSDAPVKVQMGLKVTEGLGAGARPDIGASAAEEAIEQIVDQLAGSHMCFITAGMGGGTGTGAAPIIAQAARELGVLTVGVVTKPFQFEGRKRMTLAEDGIDALQRVVDTLIIIPNQNLFRLANEQTTFTEAFSLADDVLYQGVKGVTDLMVRPGLINLDFADVRAVMDEMGKAMMGTGEAEGDERAVQAAEKAIANPLLDEVSLEGAKGVLINITGGEDLTLFELDEAANRIREKVDADANIIVGSTLDADMKGMMRVSVVATGIDAAKAEGEAPARRRLVEPLEPAPDSIAAVAGGAPAPEHEPAPEEEDIAGVESFDAVRAERNATAERSDDGDLPPPAYRPAFEGGESPAPRPRGPGAPTPDALERLQAAAARTTRAAPAQHDGASEESETAAERQRFGIGSLIHRMAGHANEASPARGEPPVSSAARRQGERAAPAPRHRAPAPDDSDEPGDERVEIPAFLRRQAN